MTSPSSPVSLQVYAACEGAPLTLEEIADLSGVSVRTLYRMRAGRPVHTDSLEAVARVLGLRLTLSLDPQEGTP